MKTFKKLFLSLLVALPFFASTNLYAQDTSPNDEIWYTSMDGQVVTPFRTNAFGATIVSNTYSAGKGVIKFSGNVTSIGDWAFDYCSSLTSITIPNSVTSIGSSAFYYCSSLASITIPNSVTSIGGSAFEGCSSLASITIPNSVTSIGSYAFSGCSSLSSVHINSLESWCKIKFGSNHANPTSYSHKLYLNNVEVKDVVIPSTIDTINAYAFYNCSSLASITIPKSVTSIGNEAFTGCYLLLKDFINYSIYNPVIYNYWGACILDEITPDGLCIINKCIVNYRGNATYLNIPNSITIIGQQAFYNCSSLTSITIPKSVTSIGNEAFFGCRLVEIECHRTIPAGISHFDPDNYTSPFSYATFQHACLLIPVNSFWTYVYDSNWYPFNNIKEQALIVDELSNKQVYAIKNRATRGYLIYDAVNEKTRELSATSPVNDEALTQHWQIVSSNSQKFLYNLGAKKYAYVQANGEIVMSDTPVAVNITNNDKGIQLGHQGEWSFVLNNNLAISDVVGINDVDADVDVDEIYNLAGQKFQKPQKGINIINGKKVLF